MQIAVLQLRYENVHFSDNSNENYIYIKLHKYFNKEIYKFDRFYASEITHIKNIYVLFNLLNITFENTNNPLLCKINNYLIFCILNNFQLKYIKYFAFCRNFIRSQSFKCCSNHQLINFYIYFNTESMQLHSFHCLGLPSITLSLYPFGNCHIYVKLKYLLNYDYKWKCFINKNKFVPYLAMDIFYERNITLQNTNELLYRKHATNGNIYDYGKLGKINFSKVSCIAIKSNVSFLCVKPIFHVNEEIVLYNCIVYTKYLLGHFIDCFYNMITKCSYCMNLHCPNMVFKAFISGQLKIILPSDPCIILKTFGNIDANRAKLNGEVSTNETLYTIFINTFWYHGNNIKIYVLHYCDYYFIVKNYLLDWYNIGGSNFNRPELCHVHDFLMLHVNLKYISISILNSNQYGNFKTKFLRSYFILRHNMSLMTNTFTRYKYWLFSTYYGVLSSKNFINFIWKIIL